MARLRALPLPPEGTPFILVLDEVNELSVDFTHPSNAAALTRMREESGARFVFVTTESDGRPRTRPQGPRQAPPA
jgi:dihydrodipicolinate reductase